MAHGSCGCRSYVMWLNPMRRDSSICEITHPHVRLLNHSYAISVTNVYTYMYIYTYTCIQNIYMYICIYMYVHTYEYIYMYVYTHIYIDTRVLAHTHIHIHTKKYLTQMLTNPVRIFGHPVVRSYIALAKSIFFSDHKCTCTFSVIWLCKVTSSVRFNLIYFQVRLGPGPLSRCKLPVP